jgi:hypothetical protein
MAEPIGAALDAVITKAQAVLQDVRLVRRDERPARALIDFEGRWGRVMLPSLQIMTRPHSSYALLTRYTQARESRMECEEVLEQTTALLQRQDRLSYSALQGRF